LIHGGSAAHPQTGQGLLTSVEPEASGAAAQMIQRLINLLPEEDTARKKSLIQEQIDAIAKQPYTIAQQELLKSLNEQMKSLEEAVDENTDALQAKLDPLFSEGHEYINKLRIGYYKAQHGLEGVVQGPRGQSDSRRFLMDLTPGELVQITPPGEWEGRGTQANNDNSRNVTQHLTFNFHGNEGQVDRLTARQRAQGFMRAATRAATA
jgi:hypothetical protein